MARLHNMTLTLKTAGVEATMTEAWGRVRVRIIAQVAATAIVLSAATTALILWICL